MGRDHFPWVGLGRCLGRVKFVLGLEEQAWRDGEENERGGGGGGSRELHCENHKGQEEDNGTWSTRKSPKFKPSTLGTR